MNSKKLNEKERKFVGEILRGTGKEKSAIKAGYSASGAASMATRLLKKPHIRAAIEEFHQRADWQVAVDHERLRRRWLALAELDPAMLFEADGKTPRPLNEIPRKFRAAVSAFRSWDSPEQGSGSAIKFVEPITAMERYLKQFPKSEKGLDLTAEAESLNAKLDDIERKLDADLDMDAPAEDEDEEEDE